MSQAERSNQSKRVRNRIAFLRAQLGWRQLDLARRLDVYQSEVSQIERGEREPGVHLAKRIARALGKTVEEVF
jgi:putative transcriptional regulator